MLVEEWHSLSSSEWHRQELAPLVAELLTEPVTRALPPPWQGTYEIERARDWIADRDAEGTTLLIIDKATCRAIGLMILFELREDDPSTDADVRLGYLLAETTWGQGFASELVAGFVDGAGAGPRSHRSPAARRRRTRTMSYLASRRE